MRKAVLSVVHYIALELPGLRLPDETAKLQIAIKEMGDAYQFQKFAWIVETELNNTQISEKLVAVLRPTDKLLVMRIHKDWVAANVPQAPRPRFPSFVVSRQQAVQHGRNCNREDGSSSRAHLYQLISRRQNFDPLIAGSATANGIIDAIREFAELGI